MGVVSGHVIGPPDDDPPDDEVDPPDDEVDPPDDEVDPPLDEVDDPPLDEDEVEDPPLELELLPLLPEDDFPLLPEELLGRFVAASSSAEVTSVTFEVQPIETSRTEETAVAASTKPTFFIRSSKPKKGRTGGVSPGVRRCAV
jgi:hypothetical protein